MVGLFGSICFARVGKIRSVKSGVVHTRYLVFAFCAAVHFASLPGPGIYIQVSPTAYFFWPATAGEPSLLTAPAVTSASFQTGMLPALLDIHTCLYTSS